MVVPAFDTGIKAFAVFLRALTFAALASNLVRQDFLGSPLSPFRTTTTLVRRSATSRRLFKLCIKGCRISRQNTTHSLFAFRFVIGRIKTHEATTIWSTNHGSTKAHAIQLEAFGFFARASHIGNFVTTTRLQLRW